jgi:hypothetical protein
MRSMISLPMRQCNYFMIIMSSYFEMKIWFFLLSRHWFSTH